MSSFDQANIGLVQVDELLGKPTLEAQSSNLLSMGLLHADGLMQLLDMATHLTGSDPGKSRQLALMCTLLATQIGAPAVLPRANYIRAQAHAANAEFTVALQLIEDARVGYDQLGNALGALRTHIGRMFVLQQLGEYQQALDTGQAILDQVAESNATPMPDTSELVARTHHNRGVCFQQMGRYAAALQAYETAESLYHRLGASELIADISNNRGVVLLNLGRGADALAAFEDAARIFSEDKLTLKQAQAQINIGDAHFLLGNYSNGLAAFDVARRQLAPLEAQLQKHELLADVGDCYLGINLFPEAVSIYREVATLAEATQMTHSQARALWGLGSALAAQSQLDKASKALAQSAKLFEQADNAPMLSNVMLKQAGLLVARGDREAAVILAEQALDLTTGHVMPLQKIHAHLRLSDWVLPDASQAQAHLVAAQSLADELGLPIISAQVSQQLGRAKLLLGNAHEAESLLLAAVNQVERLRLTLSEERMRMAFLSDKLTAYEDLVQLYLDRGEAGDVAQALSIVERAKSRVLIEMLVGDLGAQPTLLGDSAQLAQRHILQAQLQAVYSELFSGTEQYTQVQFNTLRERAVELERELNRAQLEMTLASRLNGKRNPQQIESSPRSDIHPNQNSNVIVLSYYIRGESVIAFVSAAGQTGVARGICNVSSIQALMLRLSKQWRRFAIGRAFVGQHLGQLEAVAKEILGELYNALLLPIDHLLNHAIEALSKNDDDVMATPKLVVIPHGVLHQVPFHALFDGAGYVLDRFDISYAPSATTLAVCQQRPESPTQNAVVYGVADAEIPAVMAEVGAIKSQIMNATLRVNEQATAASLRQDAHQCRILHLACHGLFRADNPMFSALKLSDGWFMAKDVMELRLEGALVTLSACETGQSRVMGGDEILGLTRAFLLAGATSLVVSLWLVQDETTAELMTLFYKHLNLGQSRGTALREAQLTLKSRMSHPYYWAPFVLVGHY